MSEIITVGLDLAKNVFQVHGANGAGRAVLRKKDTVHSGAGVLQLALLRCGNGGLWRRSFRCAVLRFQGREIGNLGDDVRLIPPAYVKPFVKRQKNDMADAEAICEAAMRPTMRFVSLKSEETQGAAMVFRVRELLIRRRTQTINALWGGI